MVIVYYTLRLFLLYPYLEEVQKGRQFYVYEDWIRQMRIDTINISGVYLRAVHEYINWILCSATDNRDARDAGTWHSLRNDYAILNYLD